MEGSSFFWFILLVSLFSSLEIGWKSDASLEVSCLGKQFLTLLPVAQLV